jgi:dTDP-4-dehydrorhamnose 3,5-epimerase
MIYKETKLKGCFEVIPVVHRDERGYLVETFRETQAKGIEGFTERFVQDNQSESIYGTIRGLHFQTGAHAQAKLIRVVSGEILDVAVDLRNDSPTYGEHIALALSAKKGNQLWIPKGFAHGFAVLSDTAIVCYKSDAYYYKEAEGGIHPLDPSLGIDWQIPREEQLISKRDLALPFIKEGVK